MIVNRQQLSETIGRAPATITEMVKGGCPYVSKPETRNGVWEFETVDVINWMLDQRGAGEGNDEDEARILRDAKRRDAVAQADLREMEREERMKRLVPIEMVIERIEAGDAIVKSRLQAIPGRLGQAISVETDAAACTAMLKAEVNEALGEISKHWTDRG